MGYTTEFTGQIEIDPPLSQEEIKFLQKFNKTRRMKRAKGPYFVDGSGYAGQGNDPDIEDFNNPPEFQPGLWCHWRPSDDGKWLEWDGGEKFYDSPEWMKYIIQHFIGSDPIAKGILPFLQPHTLNGEIEAQGEEHGDHWFLFVEDNEVWTARGEVSIAPGTKQRV